MAGAAIESALPLTVIGTIHSPFTQARGTPIQPPYAESVQGTVVVSERYAEALTDIEGFDWIWLLYWMDRANSCQPLVVPYRDTRTHGVLATRSPCRPNPIGLSAVRLLRREGSVLHVANVDVLDGTPLLDLKPYVPSFDVHTDARAGWFDDTTEDRRLADGRFHQH